MAARPPADRTRVFVNGSSADSSGRFDLSSASGPGFQRSSARAVGGKADSRRLEQEAGLFTGSGEPGTVRALTSVVAYEVGQAALAKLMQDRPSIADEISVTLSRRAKSGLSMGEDGRVAVESSVTLLVSRIRQLFEVPHT